MTLLLILIIIPTLFLKVKNHRVVSSLSGNSSYIAVAITDPSSVAAFLPVTPKVQFYRETTASFPTSACLIDCGNGVPFSSPLKYS